MPSLLLRDDIGAALLRRLLPVAVLAPLALGLLVERGERLGLYDADVADGITAIAVVVVFAALLWRAAGNLSVSAKRRARTMAALSASEERLSHYAELVEHAPVLVRDGQDRIVVWNRGMERLYGYSTRDRARQGQPRPPADEVPGVPGRHRRGAEAQRRLGGGAAAPSRGRDRGHRLEQPDGAPRRGRRTGSRGRGQQRRHRLADRRAGAPGGGTPEGRVPRHALSRAAQPARADPELRVRPPARVARQRAGPARGGGHRAPGRAPHPPGRRPPGRDAHRARQDRAAPVARRPARGRAASRRGLPGRPGGPRGGVPDRAAGGGGPGRGRRHARHPGGREPAAQRGQVHPTR